MKKTIFSVISFLLVMALFSPATLANSSEAEYEIWLADQGLNKIHIYNQDHEEIDIIDFANVGSKPHMLVFDDAGEYAYVANMGSGTVSVIRAEDREVIATLETDEGAHAAIPSPDGRMVLVANTPAQSISKILIDKENEEFTVERTVDLTQAAKLQDDSEFPNRNPICLYFTNDSKKAYVTVGGGGLFVIDTETLEITKAFGKSVVGAHGCGLILSPDGKHMYANSGSHHDGHYYIFDVETDTLIHKASSQGKDAHGVDITVDKKQLWIANRVSDDVTIMDIETKAIVDRVDYVGDAPDLLRFSPTGKYAYISLRGPEPATGTHNMAGDTPGLSIIDVHNKKLKKIIPVEGHGVDPHGLDVRVIKAPDTIATPGVEVTNGDTQINVKGKTINLPVAAVEKNGEVWISARAVAESLNGTVYWNGAERSFVIEIDSQLVKFTVGSDQAVVNGKTHQLAGDVYIDRGHSQVPAAFLLDALGK